MRCEASAKVVYEEDVERASVAFVLSITTLVGEHPSLMHHVARVLQPRPNP